MHIPFRVPFKCIDCGKKNESVSALTLRCQKCRWKLYDIRVMAINAVANAVRKGEIPAAKTLVCVDCEGRATEYDHRDYRKPLEVAPVCRPCNQRRGPAVWRNYKEQVAA